MSEEMRSKFLSGNHHHGSGEPGCWGNNPRGRGPPGPGQRPPRPEPSEDNPDLGDNDDFNDMDEKSKLTQLISFNFLKLYKARS